MLSTTKHNHGVPDGMNGEIWEYGQRAVVFGEFVVPHQKYRDQANGILCSIFMPSLCDSVMSVGDRSTRVRLLRALHNGFAVIMLRVYMLLAIGMAGGKLRD